MSWMVLWVVITPSSLLLESVTIGHLKLPWLSEARRCAVGYNVGSDLRRLGRITEKVGSRCFLRRYIGLR